MEVKENVPLNQSYEIIDIVSSDDSNPAKHGLPDRLQDTNRNKRKNTQSSSGSPYEATTSSINSNNNSDDNSVASPLESRNESSRRKSLRILNPKIQKTDETPSITVVKSPARNVNARIKSPEKLSSKRIHEQLKESEAAILKNIEKLRKEKVRLSRVIDETVKFPVRDELVPVLDPQGKARKPLPLAMDSISNVPRQDATNFFTAWDFVNTFGKRLGLYPFSLEEFADLMLYTAKPSVALTELFVALLRLILTDKHQVTKVNQLIPKSVNFAYRKSVNSASLIQPVTGNVANGISNGNNKRQSDKPPRVVDEEASRYRSLYGWLDDITETTPPSSHTHTSSSSPPGDGSGSFDITYNGLKVLPAKVSVQMCDPLRWSAVLRCVLLRLDHVQVLRKTVQDVANVWVKSQSHQVEDGMRLDSCTKTPLPSHRILPSSTQLTRYHHPSPSAMDPEPVLHNPSSSSSKQALSGGLNAEDCPYFSNHLVDKSMKSPTLSQSSSSVLLLQDVDPFTRTPSRWPPRSTHPSSSVEVSEAIMTQINTPKTAKGSSSGRRSGLDKDAIFGITSHPSVRLDEVLAVAAVMEWREMHELSLGQKLIVLQVLLHACYDTARIQDLMDRNAEERANRIQQMNKLLKDAKTKIKDVSESMRQAAIEKCRQINRKKGGKGTGGQVSVNGKGKGSETSTSTNKYDPTPTQLAMVLEEMLLLEYMGVDEVKEDLTATPLTGFEEKLLSQENEDLLSELMARSSSENGGSGAAGRGMKRRRGANETTEASFEEQLEGLSRSELQEVRRKASQKVQRNRRIELADQLLSDAMESRRERDLKAAIRCAEKAGFKGGNQDGTRFCTERLKKVYKVLSELEQKAKENRILSKHERDLEECFVRTEPIGSDRFQNLYWAFEGDDRLFVQQRKLSSERVSDEGSRPSLLSPPWTGPNVDLSLLQLYRSRPSRYDNASEWSVYSTSGELWHLCDALDDRGERESELKLAIKARFDVKQPPVIYLKAGSDWIGRKVSRSFGNKKPVRGVITGWLPANEEDPAIWHVVHEDGDEENLEESEIRDSLYEEEGEETGSVEEGDRKASKKARIIDPKEGMDRGGDEEDDTVAVSNEISPETDSEVPLPLDGSSQASVWEPKIVRSTANVSRSGSGIRSSQIGLSGLKHEIQQLHHRICETMKRLKIPDGTDRFPVFSRDGKKQLEGSLIKVQTLSEVVPLVRWLEESVHGMQSVADRRDEDEMRIAADQLKLKMLKEGWIFERRIVTSTMLVRKTEPPLLTASNETVVMVEVPVQEENYVGRSVRRFFRKFGKSDGRIICYLPPDRNEGLALYHMVHDDGDSEDLEIDDVRRAVKAFENNLQEDDEEGATGESDSDEEEEDEESEDTPDGGGEGEGRGGSSQGTDDDDYEEEEEEESEEYELSQKKKAKKLSGTGGSSSSMNHQMKLAVVTLSESIAAANSNKVLNPFTTEWFKRPLWPTHEVRIRWMDSLAACRTVAEMALACSCLSEHVRMFGAMDEDETVETVVLPPRHLTGSSTAQTASTSHTRIRSSRMNVSHESKTTLNDRHSNNHRRIQTINSFHPKANDANYKDNEFGRNSLAHHAKMKKTHSNNVEYIRPKREAALMVGSYAI